LRLRPEKTQASVKKEQAAVEKDGRVAPFATDVRCALVSNRRSLRSRREQESAKRRTKRFGGVSPLALKISGAANPRRARRSASPSAQNKRGSVRTKERGSRKKVLPKKKKGFEQRDAVRILSVKKGGRFGVGPCVKKAGSLGAKGAEYKPRTLFLRHRPEKTQAAVKKNRPPLKKTVAALPSQQTRSCALVEEDRPSVRPSEKKSRKPRKDGSRRKTKDAFFEAPAKTTGLGQKGTGPRKKNDRTKTGFGQKNTGPRKKAGRLGTKGAEYKTNDTCLRHRPEKKQAAVKKAQAVFEKRTAEQQASANTKQAA